MMLTDPLPKKTIMEAYWFVYLTVFLVILIQVPIGIDLLRFMFPNWKLARAASRSIHFILFLVVGTIFCIALGYHIFIYLPLLAGQQPLQSLKGVAHLVFAVWVWVNVVGNYYYSVFLLPGQDRDYIPPKKGPRLCFLSPEGIITEVKGNEDCESREQQQQQQACLVQQRHVQREDEGRDEGGVSSAFSGHFFCDASLVGTGGVPKTGAEWRPNHTHYCKICECAIPYLDHHCPFTGNCTGLKNYSNFFLGLLYGTLGLFYAVLITLPYFFECNMKNVLWYFGLTSSRNSYPVCSTLGPHSYIFLPVFAGFCITGNMLLLQVFFLAADLSTYSILSNRLKVPILRFMLQRMKARKFLDRDSRLNVLFRKQKTSLLHYLLPTKNQPITL